MTTSRNAPCPCGSGKKYKKCCLQRDEEAATLRALAAAPIGRSTSRRNSTLYNPDACGFTPPLLALLIEGGPCGRAPGAQGLSPYVIARVACDERYATNPKLKAAVSRNRAGSTPDKVAALGTEELERGLLRLGISCLRDQFLALAGERLSAWSIADEWTAQAPFTGTDDDRCFAGLAACELWSRLLPERPSMELLDERMQQGYRLAEDGREDEACEVWWRLWEVFRSRLTPELRTVWQADRLINGIQLVGNWLQSFEDALELDSNEAPHHAEWGRQLCAELIAQFTEESPNAQVNRRRALAAFLFELKRPAEALAALAESVARWPTEVWGYIFLADAHSHFFGDPGIPRDLALARRLLEQGLAAAPDDHGRLSIEERLSQFEPEARPRGRR